MTDLPAGQGRLADVLATRGGKAAPEAPFVIEHREALIYMLCEAAELEHAIMCQYLFAAFSVKQAVSEGLSDAELAAATRWRQQVSHVATQEMLHLALVQNLLSAVGAAPHLVRPNLPQPANHFPAGVQLALLPFGEQALRHFMFLERPEGMDLDDAEGLAAIGVAAPMMNQRDIVPQAQDFKTVGHLYRSIEQGFAHLAAKYGESWLFVGPPRAQATQQHFGWPELVAVTDLASAQRAIDEILEQGEGPRGHWRDAHFGQFVRILDEYHEMKAANPALEPARPVIAANVRSHERGADVPLISDPLTARVTDLFNVGYEILLQIFERFFAHTDETDAQLKALADATIGLMLRVLKPLGDIITTLPVGPEQPGSNAGPSFELFYESDYLMPHREAAWALLSERLDTGAWLCSELMTGRGKHLVSQLEPVLDAMRQLSRSLAAHLPAGSPHAELAVVTARLDSKEYDALLGRAHDLAAAVAVRPDSPLAGELAKLFDAANAIASSAATPAESGSAATAAILPRIVDSVLRPIAAAIRNLQADQGGQSAGVTGMAAGAADELAREPGGAGTTAERVWQTAKAATGLRAGLGATGGCPPELAEAAAALQDLALSLTPGSQRAGRLAELWELQAGLRPLIQTASNGPYLVTNLPRLIGPLGEESRPAPQLALCRCGGSSIKPRCDGACAQNGFSDAKDPNRVPDRQDSYAGQQVTILDNRGICQHSGFCTDRLATVFRTAQEPFVAPSGGRLDEIIRAVRDCPSGALSYAFDGIEAREQVDWGGTRDPAMQITQDGPYRITGSIPLAGSDGGAVPRAQGASQEHYALCRCGHSQNKPFCSGMHWYVEFRDPVAADGHEPTLFEWAGGLPALTRMTRLFYEKHVPADPLLAPLFADMPPGQPQRLAGWLAEALGGPAADLADGGSTEFAMASSGAEVTRDQQARWAALMCVAADETGLPSEPAFRSALSSVIDWRSRSAPVPDGAAPMPVPRWDWGPGGPPPRTTASPATAADGAPAGAADAAADSAPVLPGPGETVSFAAHISPLFRERDRQSMSFAFDLSSYDDVRQRATEILRRLQDGSMPCDGAWPGDRVEVFRRWTESGMQQ